MAEKIEEKLLDDFFSTWSDVIKKIEQNPIESYEINRLVDLYVMQARTALSTYKLYNNDPDKLLMLHHKIYTLYFPRLAVAGSISIARWKEKHPSILNIFAGNLKIPDINLGINLPSHK